VTSPAFPRTALVLAGGLGTRLRPALADTPKVLAPVGDRPFLLRLLTWLQRSGLRRVVLCTGHMAEQVEAAVAAGIDGLEISCAPEPSPLGTGGALRRAVLGLPDPRVLALNGDSFCGCDLHALAAQHGPATPASMVVTRVPDAARYGGVTLSEDGEVLGFVEKGLAGPGWINAGIYLLERRVLVQLPADGPCSLERELLPGLVGHGLRAVQAPGPFIDIGTPESWARAADVLAGVLA